MKHSKNVEKYPGTLRELARDIVNMRYDSFAELYKYISEELLTDSGHDKTLGHEDVSRLLKKIAEDNSINKEDAESLWKICKKYMAD